MSENNEIKVVAEQEPTNKPEKEAIISISVKMFEDGQIAIEVSDTKDNKRIDITTLENILRTAHDTIYEQKIIQLTLDTLKKSL